MIKSFRNKETEELFEGRISRRFSAKMAAIAFRKLVAVNGVRDVNQLRIPPGNRLEKLKGDKQGLYSIRINDQYRVCFEWRGQDVYQVEIVDYH